MAVTPTYAIGDKVQFISPFTDGIVYTVTDIKYFDEDGIYVEPGVITDFFGYELTQHIITNSVEAYIEPAPV